MGESKKKESGIGWRNRPELVPCAGHPRTRYACRPLRMREESLKPFTGFAIISFCQPTNFMFSTFTLKLINLQGVVPSSGIAQDGMLLAIIRRMNSRISESTNAAFDRGKSETLKR